MLSSQAIDGLVQAMADVPVKLNEAATQVELDAEVNLKQAIENAIDAKITALEAEAEELAAAADDYLEEEEGEEANDELEMAKEANVEENEVDGGIATLFKSVMEENPSVDVEVVVSGGDVVMETDE